MPLVRIDLIEGRSAPQVAAISKAIQRALVDCLDMPARDQFQFRAIDGAETGVLRPCSRAPRRRSGDAARECHDRVD